MTALLSDRLYEMQNSFAELQADMAAFLADIKRLDEFTTTFADQETERLLCQINDDFVPSLVEFRRDVLEPRMAHFRDLLEAERDRLLVEKIYCEVQEKSNIFIGDNTAFLYGKALQHNNETVQRLAVGDSYMNVNDAELIAQFIKKSSSLKEFVLCLEDEDPTIIKSLVRAAAKNSNIIKFAFEGVPFIYEMIQILLSKSRSLECLRICEDESNTEWTTAAKLNLPDAFYRNRTLHTLFLDNMAFTTASKNFSILASGMKQSRSLRELGLQGCTFNGSSTPILLELLCHLPSNVEKLTLDCCDFEYEDGEPEVVIDDIFVQIITNYSCELNLKEIELHGGKDVSKILRPFQNDKFTFEYIRLFVESDDVDRQVIETMKVLPFLQGLKKLWIGGECDEHSIDNVYISALEKAMRKNFCLQEFTIDLVDDSSVPSLQKDINLLCMRNLSIQDWVRESHGVSLLDLYLPRVLFQSIHYEFKTDIIFRLLKNNDWSAHRANNDISLGSILCKRQPTESLIKRKKRKKEKIQK